MAKLAHVYFPYMVYKMFACVSNRENKEYVEGLNSKVKLGLYKSFSKEVDTGVQ